MGRGSLEGLRVVELQGLAPAPFGVMVLADLGAEVLRVTAKQANPAVLRPPPGPLDRGRHDLALNLKDAADAERLRALVGVAGVFVEGYRPGVTERLGLGLTSCSL